MLLECLCQESPEYGSCSPASCSPIWWPVPPERQCDIRFTWAPGTAVVASRFPLARIWALHRPGYAGEFDVDWSSAQAVLVARCGYAVTVREATAGEVAFLSQSLVLVFLG